MVVKFTLKPNSTILNETVGTPESLGTNDILVSNVVT